MEPADYSWFILLRRLEQEELERDWGGVCQKWESLRAQMHGDDEVWEFECSESHQHPLSGCSGVAVIRGTEIIGHVVTTRRLS